MSSIGLTRKARKLDRLFSAVLKSSCSSILRRFALKDILYKYAVDTEAAT